MVPAILKLCRTLIGFSLVQKFWTFFDANVVGQRFPKSKTPEATFIHFLERFMNVPNSTTNLQQKCLPKDNVRLLGIWPNDFRQAPHPKSSTSELPVKQKQFLDIQKSWKIWTKHYERLHILSKAVDNSFPLSSWWDLRRPVRGHSTTSVKQVRFKVESKFLTKISSTVCGTFTVKFTRFHSMYLTSCNSQTATCSLHALQTAKCIRVNHPNRNWLKWWKFQGEMFQFWQVDPLSTRPAWKASFKKLWRVIGDLSEAYYLTI